MILLFISDAPLRDAVTEQLAAAKLGDAVVADTAQTLIKKAESDANAVILLDKADDKKTGALIQSLLALAEKPALLALGSADEIDGISESFPKPLRLGHLIARLRYYLETAPLLRHRAVEFGPYKLEPQNRRLLRDNGEPVRLTEKETALLVFLAGQKQPATRRDILAGVWGYDERIDTHTLETHIYQLRRKLDGDHWLINEAGAYHLARGA